MKELEERILKDGTILPGEVLKVGNFLNHQIDTNLLSKMVEEVKKYFVSDSFTKVLTIEASGIAFATAIGLAYNVPIVFAKKSVTSNVKGELFTAEVYSYTHQKVNTISVPSEYINKGEKVLIVDDFLAKGNAFKGLIEIVNKAQATVVGCVDEIEKVDQDGGNQLRSAGYKVLSLAKIKNISEGKIEFC